MIRFAEKTDIGQIAEIFKQLHLKHCEIRDEDFNVPSDGFYANAIERTMDVKDNLRIAVCVEDGAVKGYSEFFIHEAEESETRKYCKICFIKRLAVDINYQRQGVGSKLIGFIKNYAVENGCSGIELDVLYENYDAVDFCSSAGFVPIMYKMEMKLN